eukprot:TRINITY_DN1940_c0_g2_i1.p1 TRINITY_DN1940_c0_g2~~TRINITY_DN1940_c0_g2_i1.p1  ORF type:complete len:790 (-),score=274.19 TRINITY_DN1940_c0_g2_i1:16-2385(-)
MVSALGDLDNVQDEGGFLTDEQREQLSVAAQEREGSRAATASAVASNGAASGPRTKHQPHHAPLAAKQERKSHSLRNGRPKKGGGGGRGTWGNPMDPNQANPPEIDSGDPLYDDEEGQDDDGDEEDNSLHKPLSAVTPASSVAASVEDFKERVGSILQEYFASGDVAAAASDMLDIGTPSFHHHFVKRAVSKALDRHDREKEMAAVLLSSLYCDVIQPEQVEKGFHRIVSAADDLSLDCPDADDVIALFITRAIVDDILPPAFLSRARKSLVVEGNGKESKAAAVLRLAESHLTDPHHAERVERVWGGSSRVTVDMAKERIKKLLKEYVVSGDKVEACRCIRELNLPFFHHEVVKCALIMAMELPSSSTGHVALLDLLKETAEEGLISLSQMAKGFGRLSEAKAMADLSLDIPQAKELLLQFISTAIASQWLSASAAKTLQEELTSPPPDSPKEAEESKLLQEYKQKCTQIVREYLESGDVKDVAESLEELAYPDFVHHFVRRLVTMAMDRHNREKEMASVLLSSLYGEAIPSDQIEAAFTRMLENVEDLALDIPNAAAELAMFLARAVVDDILAPQFVSERAKLLLREHTLGQEVLASAQGLLSARHAGERILRCWGGGFAARAGGGTMITAEDAKEKVRRLVEEYLVGGELDEACVCIRDLNLPFFHHEVVKVTLVAAMDKPSLRSRAVQLLQRCAEEGLISSSQMEKGFGRVRDSMADLALDIPSAPALFQEIVKEAKEKFATPSSLFSDQLQEAKGDASAVRGSSSSAEPETSPAAAAAAAAPTV